MELLDSRYLKGLAGERLSQSRCPHKTVALLYGAVGLGAALVVSLLQYVLNQQIGNTGGLSGLGARSVLQTVQTVLQYAVNIALPFWEMGFLFLTLRLARGEAADKGDLTAGFRRFGPVLRLLLIEGLLYSGAGIACLYAGAFVFAMSPLSFKMVEVLTPMIENGDSMEQIQEAIFAMPMEELLGLLLPFLIIAGILFAVVGIYLFYRFRLARLLVMDKKGMGAFAALILSGRMTKRRKWKLFRLDLSFWWYYALMALSVAVMYADVALQLAIPETVSRDLLWLVCYALGVLLQLLLIWRRGSYVQTTYAAAYDQLLQAPAEGPRPRPTPQNLPWDYETE